MTTLAANLPLRGLKAGFRRFTVAEYHKLIDIGLLTEDDRLELLEGYLVNQLPRNPSHDGTIDLVRESLMRVLPPNWLPRCQEAITLADSEPEPDFALARGTSRSYLTRHPGPADLGLVAEVANTTLDEDRLDKGRIYARAGIPWYWIVNVVDRQVETYSVPSGPTPAPAYGRRTDYRVGDDVPLELDGRVVARLPVQEMLP